MKELEPVRLLAEFKVYNAGEVVCLPPVDVESLVKQGRATRIEAGPLAPPAEELPPPPDPVVTREANPDATKPVKKGGFGRRGG